MTELGSFLLLPLGSLAPDLLARGESAAAVRPLESGSASSVISTSASRRAAWDLELFGTAPRPVELEGPAAPTVSTSDPPPEDELGPDDETGPRLSLLSMSMADKGAAASAVEGAKAPLAAGGLGDAAGVRSVGCGCGALVMTWSAFGEECVQGLGGLQW